RIGVMLQRRRVVALALTGIVSISAGLLAQKKDDKKQDEAQKKEVQNIVKLADDAAAGQTVPNDLSLTWVRQDPLKAQGNKEYVPFIVTIDPSKVSSDTVALYWRVVPKNGTATPTPAAEAPDKKDKDKDKDKDKKRVEYPYEDVSFIPVTAGPPST